MTDHLPSFLYPVPVGATIPPGTPFWRLDRHNGRLGMVCREENGWHCGQGDLFWTVEPIPRPLPTDPGSLICSVSDAGGRWWPHGVLVQLAEEDRWQLFNHERGVFVAADQISSWRPAKPASIPWREEVDW